MLWKFNTTSYEVIVLAYSGGLNVSFDDLKVFWLNIPEAMIEGTEDG